MASTASKVRRPALSSGDVAVLAVTANSVWVTGAILTSNERVEAKRLRQADVTVGSSDSWWTNALTSHWFTQTAGTLALCHNAPITHRQSTQTDDMWTQVVTLVLYIVPMCSVKFQHRAFRSHTITQWLL